MILSLILAMVLNINRAYLMGICLEPVGILRNSTNSDQIAALSLKLH